MVTTVISNEIPKILFEMIFYDKMHVPTTFGRLQVMKSDGYDGYK